MRGVCRKAELLPKAQAMRAEGKIYRDIASELGIAIQTVGEWFSDPDRSKVRTRRQKYRGKCIDCGAPTDGSAGYGKAPKRCGNCNLRYTGDLSQERWRERRETIEGLWACGYTGREITEELEIPYDKANISRWRGNGYNLPYRKPSSIEWGKRLTQKRTGKAA